MCSFNKFLDVCAQVRNRPQSFPNDDFIHVLQCTLALKIILILMSIVSNFLGKISKSPSRLRYIYMTQKCIRY